MLTTEKKRVGRPRKNPVQPVEASTPKRGVGRPRKNPVAEVTEVTNEPQKKVTPISIPTPKANASAEALRNMLIEELGLNKTTSLQAAVTLFFMRTADLSTNYNDFIRHEDNRKIKGNHVATLCEILKEEGELQIWYPILVVKNYLGKTHADPKGSVEDETIETRKGKANRKGTDVPNYIIVDGQHRFEAFMSEGKEIVFCDLSAIYGDRVKDPKFVKEVVDKFNIGVKSYTKGETRHKRKTSNHFLKVLGDEAAKITNVRIHKDKNMRSEYVKHSQKGYEAKNFADIISNSWIENSLGNVAREHVKTSYMSKKTLSPSEIAMVRKAVWYSKCFIDGLDGHFPSTTTEAYGWVGYMTKNVKGTNIDLEYYDKLSKFLRERMLKRNDGSAIRSKSDLRNATDMYRDYTLVKDFLKANYKFKTIVKAEEKPNGDIVKGVYEITAIK